MGYLDGDDSLSPALPPPPRHYRQGDVLLIEAGSLPTDAVREGRQDARLVLAYGEATGHAHVIAAPRSGASLYRSANGRYLEVVAPTEMVHEEHAAIAIPPAVYQVRIQREYVAPERPRGIGGRSLSRPVID